MAQSGFWLLAAAWSALAAATAFAAETVIAQKDLEFRPEKVQIRTGDTLVFTNEDNYGHNMHSVSPGSEFDLGRQAPGTKVPYTFRRAGTFEVFCRIHPKMRLEVLVR
jgi:cytochrome c peroxidase